MRLALLTGLVVATLSSACSSVDMPGSGETPGSGGTTGAGGTAGAGGSSAAVGAHVWTASSASLELRNVWTIDGFIGAPSSGSQCWSFDRGALSDAQRAFLENLTLVPLQNNCSSDGYSYYQLTVIDADGSSAVYRDTGCSYLRAVGAQAMLPAGTFPNDAFSSGNAVACAN
jgi:hypothetical protein